MVATASRMPLLLAQPISNVLYIINYKTKDGPTENRWDELIEISSNWLTDWLTDWPTQWFRMVRRKKKKVFMENDLGSLVKYLNFAIDGINRINTN